MTCIAVRGRTMAADSRFVGDYITSGIKLYRRAGAVIGFCGTVEQALVFVDWYADRKSRRPDLANEQDWRALVLTKAGIEEWGPSLRPIPVLESYAAIGSGAQHAITAMDLKASARQAVEVAIRRDPNCGHPVVTMTLQSASKRRKRTA